MGPGPIWGRPIRPWFPFGPGPIWAWVRFGPGQFGPVSRLGWGPIWPWVPFCPRSLFAKSINSATKCTSSLARNQFRYQNCKSVSTEYKSRNTHTKKKYHTYTYIYIYIIYIYRDTYIFCNPLAHGCNACPNSHRCRIAKN